MNDSAGSSRPRPRASIPGSKGLLLRTQRAPGPPVPAPPVSEPGSQRCTRAERTPARPQVTHPGTPRQSQSAMWTRPPRDCRRKWGPEPPPARTGFDEAWGEGGSPHVPVFEKGSSGPGQGDGGGEPPPPAPSRFLSWADVTSVRATPTPKAPRVTRQNSGGRGKTRIPCARLGVRLPAGSAVPSRSASLRALQRTCPESLVL